MRADDRPVAQEEAVVRLVPSQGGVIAAPLLDADSRALVRVEVLRDDTYIVVLDGAHDG